MNSRQDRFCQTSQHDHQTELEAPTDIVNVCLFELDTASLFITASAVSTVGSLVDREIRLELAIRF